MSNHLLNAYQTSSSWLHQLAASHKMLGALLIIIATVSQRPGNWLVVILIALTLCAITFTANLKWPPLIRRLLMLELLAIGIAVLPLLQGNGVELFLFSLARISLCLFTMILLSSTTRFADILKVLLDLHIPPLIITTLALMYRYLFLLQDEMQTLNRARRSRTFSNNKTLIWQSNANLLAQLFIRATERAERIYGAMKARGWKG